MVLVPSEAFNTFLAYTGAAAGTTTVTAAVAVSKGRSLELTVHVGAIVSTGTLVITPQYSTDGGSNYTSVSSKAVSLTDADANKLVIFEFPQIAGRITHIRLSMARATANVTIGSVIAKAYLERGVLPRGEGGAASALDSTVVSLKRVNVAV